jgi:hypothetical protein
MKQLNSDFRNAKVGDKVYYLGGIIGEITSIEEQDVYAIEVNDDELYTWDGKVLLDDSYATIYTHPVKIIHADDMPVNPRIAEVERQIQRLKNELETLKEVSK